MIIHTVNSGDTLYKLASTYGVSIEEITKINEANSNDTLVIGQTLVIPTNTMEYIVKSGDTLYSIAQRLKVPLESLIKSNPQITNPAQIRIGDKLTIEDTNGKLRSVEVNGYALPGIDYDVLIKTLPNLTYISIFSYQIKNDGTFDPIDDEEIVNEAKRFNVAPLMVITNIGDRGFDSDITRAILNNQEIRTSLIQNLITAMKNKGYYGLNVDFEYIYPEDREAYNTFIKELSEILELNDLKLFTALAPKESEQQIGLLYQAHDYKFHGKYVDKVVLMTYEWGYLYGEPQAVSPINPIRNVLNYAVKVIPSEKILMGMSNYGYDWTLPYKQGTPAKTLSNTGAVKLARKVGANIEYSEKDQSPFFTYYSQNIKHIVWFDDARSYFARLKLVDEYNLAGVSYWTINQYYPQNWLVLNDLYDIVKVI